MTNGNALLVPCFAVLNSKATMDRLLDVAWRWQSNGGALPNRLDPVRGTLLLQETGDNGLVRIHNRRIGVEGLIWRTA